MRVSTAYVLAAGLGTRLRPLTNERAKPLVEVCGTRLIDFALQLLADAGITRVGINSHWLHPQIPDALGKRWRDAIDVVTTHEPDVLGTGGGLVGLAKACPAPANEKVIVLNADALIDVDLRALVDAGVTHGDALATLVLKEVPDVDKYGALGTDDDDVITDFAGRAHTGDVKRRRMFCGVHLVDPRAFSILPDVVVDGGVARGTMSGINDDGYPVWMKRGEKLRAFDVTSTFCDVGTPERLLEANLRVLDGTWSSEHLRPFERFTQIWPQVFVHKTARIDATAVLAAPCIVDENAVVAASARVEGSVIGRGCAVESGAKVVRSVLQSGARASGSVVDTVVGATCAMGPLSLSEKDA